FFDDLVRDFGFALRTLRKNPRFVFVSVFALTLGIGASTVVFSVFYNLLFNAFAARDQARMVVPVLQNPEAPDFTSRLWITLTDLKYLREHNQVFDGVIGFHYGRALVRNDARSFQFYNAMVTPDAFEFYGVPPLLGRGIVSQDGAAGAPKVLTMSYTTWKNEFGADPGILGKTLIVDGEPRTLVGILPERFHGFGS